MSGQDHLAGGGLAANLRAAAEARDADAGQVAASPDGGATVDTGRGIIQVWVNGQGRLGISMSNGRLRIASGSAGDLGMAVEIAAAWKSGASAGELASEFPFITVTDLARVLTSPDPVAAQWAWLRAGSWPAADRELIEAAHAHPVLRGYFPDVSMGLFEFSRSWYDREGSVRLCSTGGGRFDVHRGGSGLFGRGGKGHQRFGYASLSDAVAAAAEMLSGTFAVEPVRLRDAGRGEGVSIDLAGLRYPLDAASAPLFARDVAAGAGGELDWSAGSLAVVDKEAAEALQDVWERSFFPPGDLLAQARNRVVGLGAYVGELFVRNIGARWIDFDVAAQEAFGHPAGIELPDGALCSPVGVIFALGNDDVVDSVTSFYNRVTGRGHQG
jgi:hypothetical protein